MKRILITVGVLAVIGFVGYKMLVGSDLMSKLSYKPSGHKLTLNNLTSAHIDVMVDVTSKFKIDITIHGYDVDLSINGVKIAHINNAKVQKLVKNNTSTITLSADFNPLTVIKNVANPALIQQYFNDPSKIMIGINGVMGIEALNISDPDYKLAINSPLSDFMPKKDAKKLNAFGNYDKVPIIYQHADGGVFETWLRTGYVPAA